MRTRKFMIRKKEKQADKNEVQQEPMPQNSHLFFTDNILLNMELVIQEIGQNWDVHYREFNLGRTGIRACIIFVDGLTDKDLINKHIMRSLMADFGRSSGIPSVWNRRQCLSISKNFAPSLDYKIRC